MLFCTTSKGGTRLKKKLEIKKVTLRNLDSDELAQVAGGTACGTSTPYCSTTADTGCGLTLVSKTTCVGSC